MVSCRCNMGDKYKSEIQKPVKNTLLSGASHGFPFESFQGSSLLIPVSQDSPSVLSDCIGSLNNPTEKNVNLQQNITQAAEPVSIAKVNISSPEESKNSNQTNNMSYTGLFSSFFGGGQKKQEQDFSQFDRSHPDKPSTSRSSSPFVTVPNIQSFSPALQVPSENPINELKQTDTLNSTNFFSHSQSQFHEPSFPTFVNNNDKISSYNQANQLNEAAPPPASNFRNEIQSFFKEDINPNIIIGNQNVSSSLGFESFNSRGSFSPKISPLPESSIGDSSSFPLKTLPSNPSSSFNSPSPNPASAFFENSLTSVGPLKPVQPISENIPPLSTGPPASLSAPPLFSGVGSRNYRRSHYKSLAYAPVPGLTSNTAVSSSYLQPCENYPNLTLSSSALTVPFEPLKQPLIESLSQPALNFATNNLSSDFSVSAPSAGVNSSLPNLFNPQSFPAVTASPTHHVETLTNPLPKSNLIPQNIVTSEMPFINHSPNVSSTLPAPASVASTSMVHTLAVHSPIMSTKEQQVFSAPEKDSPVITSSSFNNLANLGNPGIAYRPVYHHWFFRIEAKEPKEIWHPFTMTDSLALEQAFNSEQLTPNTLIPTDGGRYDVNITSRTKTSVYWEEKPRAVRRCSWFYRNSMESRLYPFDENTAYILEEEYKQAATTNSWNKKIELETGECVVMTGPKNIKLQSTPQTPEGWEAEPEYSQNATNRYKIIRRGILDDIEIDDGESPNVDHLIFVVHGIGSFCDFKFRTIEEAVDGFRSMSFQLIKSHFRSSMEQGNVSRVEILPVSWHKQLHGETTGVDNKLQTITLKSIPRLRNFANDTLLDILFYSSPVYCQNIVQQVGREINTLFAKFKARNPNFKGGVSLVGHSLGSLILFDMLCHQKPPSPRMGYNLEEADTNIGEQDKASPASHDKKMESLSRSVSYVMGNAGTGQPFVKYPQFNFQPVAFFAMGSPIGMFVTVRGIDSLGLDFCFPTCSRFFNVFHPCDPVAYRIEALINPDLAEKRPVLIPHHKGRKRMHLKLKETMTKVGAILKQRLVDTVRSTWNTVHHFTTFGRADDALEQEFGKIIEKQLESQQVESAGHCVNDEDEENDIDSGQLNLGRRIDYVLQEAPLESFSEYASAFRSHVIYWSSEDTMLLILKEIYESMGITADSKHPNGVINVSQDPAASEIMPTELQDPDIMPSCSTSQEQPVPYGFK